MLKPETKFRNKIRPLLEALPNSWWESIQQKTINGTPDILGCVNGTFVALELKSMSGKATLLQLHKLEKIRHACGIAVVVNPGNWREIYLGLIALANCKEIHADTKT